MKILILTSYQKPIDTTDEVYKVESSFSIWQHLTNIGHDVTISRYDDLSYSWGKELSVKSENVDLKSFDLVFPRSITLLKKYSIDNSKLCKSVCLYTNQHKVKTVNGLHLIRYADEFNKLHQMHILKQNDFPIPKTFFSPNIKKVSNLIFPLIEKPLVGSHGDGIRIINDENDLPTKSQNFIYQEVLPDRRDYRILLVNKNPIGAMLRVAKPESIVSNYSTGGSVYPVEMTKEMKNISSNVAKYFDLDFCGIDLMATSSGNLKVLEVNRFPEFRGFEKATNINVAKKIEEEII